MHGRNERPLFKGGQGRDASDTVANAVIAGAFAALFFLTLIWICLRAF